MTTDIGWRDSHFEASAASTSIPMADFTPEIASEILSACQAGGEQAAGAFGRAFGGEFSLTVGQPATRSGDALPDTWNGPGLVITFHVGDRGALLLLPESSELLPPWYAAPDEMGRSKLATLADELGHAILPQAFRPTDVSAARVRDLAGAFKRAEPIGAVGHLPLILTSGEQLGEASLVWPVQAAAKTENARASIPERANKQPIEIDRSASPQPAQKHPIQYADIEEGIAQLPPYAKSLLKVRVPVTVTLASAKYPVSQILELGPGSIIQFSKPCEDNLTLEVGDQSIAKGEAVKVGDKFGLWITSMTMPDERFWVIHGHRSGARVK